MMKKLFGLTVYVYRWHLGDCTNNGITDRRDEFILVDDSISAPFEVKKDEIYLVLVRRTIAGENYIHAEPRMNGKPINEGRFGMFGGNFIYSSDSRFPNSYPIPVHDRFETQKEYDTYSN